eukprot:1137869-Pelagomonas_calceolata.AAC.4
MPHKPLKGPSIIMMHHKPLVGPISITMHHKPNTGPRQGPCFKGRLKSRCVGYVPQGGCRGTAAVIFLPLSIHLKGLYWTVVEVINFAKILKHLEQYSNMAIHSSWQEPDRLKKTPWTFND